MRYKGIIFDVDGTLVDAFPGIHKSLAMAMKETGVSPWDLKTTKQHVGRGVEYLVESAVGKDKKQDALEIFRKDYQTSCLKHTQLLPSVSETLPKLAAAGLLLAVATNKPLTFSNPILEQLGIDIPIV